MVRALGIVFAAVLLVACYPASFQDCTVRCTAATGCPSGLSCGAEGLCRPHGAASSCDGAPIDAPDGEDDAVDAPADASSDAPVDAPRVFTLSQTPPAPATGAGAGCEVSGTIHDGNWYRVFPLPAEITSNFVVSSVSIWIYRTQGMATVSISVGTYGGLYPSTAFQPSQFATSGPALDVDVPTTTPNGQILDVPISLPMSFAPGTKIAVKVSSQTVLLGSSGPQGMCMPTLSGTPGYFSSNFAQCNQGPLPGCNNAGFIVTVTGSY